MVSLDTIKRHYPFESHYFENNSLRYHYLDEGSGRPVIMVHGNPSWSFYYRNLVKKLKNNHRCLVPDHIGCGYSEKPSSKNYDYHFQTRAEDLSRWIESLKLDQPTDLIVHDWGGPIALLWATKNIKNINKIVILNTTGFLMPQGKKIPWALKLIRNTLFGKFLVKGLNAFSVGASLIGCKRNTMSHELRACYQAPYNNWQNRVATYEFVHDIPLSEEDRGYQTGKELESQIKVFRDTPVLICWGMKDFVFDSHFLDKFQKLLPQAEVVRFEDCGHYVLEDAAPEILNRIQKFLDHDQIH